MDVVHFGEKMKCCMDVLLRAGTKGPILYLVFFHPRTFLNCFAVELSVFKIKQLRNVLGRVLG